LNALNENHISLENSSIEPLTDWFKERVLKHERTHDYATDLTTGAKAKVGLPWLGEIFAGITTSLRINSTHKEEVRTVLTNHFSEFVNAFNKLLINAVTTIIEAQKGQSVLFIIDGTDRLKHEDNRRFFINDAYQLQQIAGNFIYCAPIQLGYEEGRINEMFKTVILPMIKIREKTDPRPIVVAYEALRAMVYKRIAPELFDAEGTVDYLIGYSGGNPRHLLRLLNNTYVEAENEILDRASAEKAVKELATDFRRILNSEDYDLLVRIDDTMDDISNDKVRDLLYKLALLEYNSYWQLSHPAIRTLKEYENARIRAGTAAVA
jgi:hypothetical protein